MDNWNNFFFKGPTLSCRRNAPGIHQPAMKQLRNNVIRAGLGSLKFIGAHHLLRPQ